jgi:hypothetical protein
MNEGIKVTLEQVEKLVNFLKPHLGLQRWDIRCAVVRPVTLDGAMADCEYNSDARIALIRVRDTQDSRLVFIDAVVHELVHCVLWWADFDADDRDGKLWSKVLEQSMRDLTNPIALWVYDHPQARI